MVDVAQMQRKLAVCGQLETLIMKVILQYSYILYNIYNNLKFSPCMG